MHIRDKYINGVIIFARLHDYLNRNVLSLSPMAETSLAYFYNVKCFSRLSTMDGDK